MSVDFIERMGYILLYAETILLTRRSMSMTILLMTWGNLHVSISGKEDAYES